MKPGDALGPEAVLALQFLDRRQGEWYCTNCWAAAVGTDARVLDLLAARMTTLDAMTAGYQAWVGGPCNVCDATPLEAERRKGLRSVRSLGRTP